MTSFGVYIDLLILGCLLSAFYVAFPRRPRLYFPIAAVLICKSLHSSMIGDNEFWIVLNIALLLSLLLALYLARESANFRWLFSALLVVKVIDVFAHSWSLEQGSFYYAWVLFWDFLILLLITHRPQLIRFLSGKNWLVISGFSRKSRENLRFSVQEMLLIRVYKVHLVVNVLSLIEDLLYHHTDIKLSVMYTIHPFFKLPANMIELLLIFSVACGYAVGPYTKQRFTRGQ